MSGGIDQLPSGLCKISAIQHPIKQRQGVTSVCVTSSSFLEAEPLVGEAGRGVELSPHHASFAPPPRFCSFAPPPLSTSCLTWPLFLSRGSLDLNASCWNIKTMFREGTTVFSNRPLRLLNDSRSFFEESTGLTLSSRLDPISTDCVVLQFIVQVTMDMDSSALRNLKWWKFYKIQFYINFFPGNCQ